MPHSAVLLDAAPFLIANFLAAVKAVTPLHVLPPHIPAFPASGRMIILSLGKAAEEMAQVALGTLQTHPGFDAARVSALAVIRAGDKLPQSNALVEVIEAAHPRPDERSARAATALLARAGFAGENDRVLCLISGGASSLTLFPARGLTLAHLQAVNDALLKGGVPIDKMNALRKHLSSFSGGRLRLATQAPVITLAISDVPGDDVCVIGSGPTVADGSSYQDALAVIGDFNLAVPPEVMAHLQRGAAGQIAETLKAGHPCLRHDEATVIASPSVAVAAGAAHGAAHGLRIVHQGIIEGEAHEVAIRMAREAMAYANRAMPPTLFVSGGELTVTLPKTGTPEAGIGTGGRNSRFLLSFLMETRGAPGIHAIACGTDGIDYVAAAGAVMTDACHATAARAGLDPADYLRRFDSHRFFEALGGLVKTGATHTNVGDYRAILVIPRSA